MTPDPVASSETRRRWLHAGKEELAMKILKRKNTVYDTARFGHPQIRVHHKRGVGKKSPRYLLKCGCCEEKLEIWYSDDGLEIGGVNGAIADWREILLPLLVIDQKGGKLIDRMKQV
jgi:hypothetical protein